MCDDSRTCPFPAWRNSPSFQNPRASLTDRYAETCGGRGAGHDHRTDGQSQETKLTDDLFPVEAFAALGYEAAYAGQKTYNGVTVLSRLPVSDVQSGVPDLQDDQHRALALTSGGVRVVCLHVPNGQAVGTDKYAYTLDWLQHTRHWLARELAEHERLVVMGDFNVAPEDRDVHSPQRWSGQVLVSPAERQAFRALLDLGLDDAFRLFEQPEKVFSWWNYGAPAFPGDWGLRIDHVLVSPALAGACRSCHVDTGPRGHERPSGHAPVVAEFATEQV